MKFSAFDQAISEATAGLNEIEAEFKKLRVKKAQLETLVRSLLAVLPMESGQQSDAARAAQLLLTESSDAPEVAAEPKATWTLARDVLAKSQGALTVPEIHKIMLASGKGEEEVPAQDAIRIAMLRKPDIFLKRDKRYALTSSQFEVTVPETKRRLQ